MLRDELLVIITFCGVVFVLLGVYFRKYNPESWVFSRAWVPVSEWIVYSSLGAVFMTLALISILFVT